MLQLSRIAALDVAEWWISFHNPCIHKVVQTKKILVLTKTVQVSPAEWQSAKVFVDDIEQRASTGNPKRHLWRIASFGIVRTFQLEVCQQ